MPRWLLALAASACAGLARGAPLLSDVRLEGLSSPLALAAGSSPRISWRSGGLQQSHRLLVSAAGSAPAGVLWDSGVVASNLSGLVTYGGPPLPADADFSLAVTVTLAGVGAVTAASPFSTARAAPLPGAWLGGADTFRAALRLSPAPVARARLHVTGVGCYVAVASVVTLPPACDNCSTSSTAQAALQAPGAPRAQ